MSFFRKAIDQMHDLMVKMHDLMVKAPAAHPPTPTTDQRVAAVAQSPINNAGAAPAQPKQIEAAPVAKPAAEGRTMQRRGRPHPDSAKTAQDANEAVAEAQKPTETQTEPKRAEEKLLEKTLYPPSPPRLFKHSPLFDRLFG